MEWLKDGGGDLCCYYCWYSDPTLSLHGQAVANHGLGVEGKGHDGRVATATSKDVHFFELEVHVGFRDIGSVPWKSMLWLVVCLFHAR